MGVNQFPTVAETKVRELVSDIIEKENLKVDSIETCPGTQVGDNYLGIITKIKIDGRRNTSGDLKELNLILKSATQNEAFRKCAPINDCYKRELFMYQKVLPLFEQFQESKGCLDKGFKNYAQVLKSSDEMCDEYLIMTDKKAEGFKMVDRKQTLDFEHCKLVLTQLGKYHAISFALRDQNPKLFENLLNSVHDFFRTMIETQMDFKKQLEDVSEKALKSLDPEKEKDLYDRFDSFRLNMFDDMMAYTDPIVADQYFVIVHGDCWSNNILYKYDDIDDPEKPTDVCFLDWQIARTFSPATDLAYFIYNCAGSKLLNEHFDELINIYYNSLSSFLKDLGSNPEKLFPYSALQDHMKKYFKHGVIMACFTIHLFTSDSEEIPNVHEIKDAESIFDILKFDSKNAHLYNERIGAVLRHAFKRGYF